MFSNNFSFVLLLALTNIVLANEFPNYPIPLDNASGSAISYVDKHQLEKLCSISYVDLHQSNSVYSDSYIYLHKLESRIIIQNTCGIKQVLFKSSKNLSIKHFMQTFQ